MPAQSCGSAHGRGCSRSARTGTGRSPARFGTSVPGCCGPHPACLAQRPHHKPLCSRRLSVASGPGPTPLLRCWCQNLRSPARTEVLPGSLLSRTLPSGHPCPSRATSVLKTSLGSKGLSSGLDKGGAGLGKGGTWQERPQPGAREAGGGLLGWAEAVLIGKGRALEQQSSGV